MIHNLVYLENNIFQLYSFFMKSYYFIGSKFFNITLISRFPLPLIFH